MASEFSERAPGGREYSPTEESDRMFKPRQNVTYNGRPAVVITEPDIGATGATLYGIRYTDMPQWQAIPGFPDIQRPTRGSCKIARAEDLTTR